jgi:hypothetical protein
MYAADLSYYKKLGPVTVTAKAQYQVQSVNTQNFVNPADPTQTYTFTNNVTSTFAQVSLRPTGLENKFRNLELGYRYVSHTAPQASLFGQTWTENDISLNYWLSWRQVLKLCYESVKNTTYDTPVLGVTGVAGDMNISRIILQFSTEF